MNDKPKRTHPTTGIEAALGFMFVFGSLAFFIACLVWGR